MGSLPITLPEGFEIKVSVGDKIGAGETLAQKNTNKDETIHLADFLSVKPQKIKKSLRKNLGEAIKKGDVLAVKSGRLGMGGKKIVSDIEGTLIRIDEEEGKIVIRTTSGGTDVQKITSPVEGVIEICDNDKIVISSDRNAISVKVATGEDIDGELLNLGENVDLLEINAGVNGKIVIGNEFERGSVSKALGLGAIGVIGVEIREAELEDAVERKIKNPIVVLDRDDYNKLSKKKGKVLIDTKNKSIVIL